MTTNVNALTAPPLIALNSVSEDYVPTADYEPTKLPGGVPKVIEAFPDKVDVTKVPGGSSSHLSRAGTLPSSVDSLLDDQHRLTIYVTLGAVLMLVIMLAASLLLLLSKRRPSKGQQLSANVQQCLMDALLEGGSAAMAGKGRVIRHDPDCPSHAPPSPPSEYHHYEEIVDRSPPRVHRSYGRLVPIPSSTNPKTQAHALWPPEFNRQKMFGTDF